MDVIASGIFVALLLTLLSLRLARPPITLGLFAVSLSAILLLFAHHASDALKVGL